MGINGLLQQLKSISRSTHVSTYRGQKVAIDGYSWLHKGAYSCSRELCEGVWADGYVRYFVSRIEMLMGNGVIPVVVFDGCRLPMKADEEDSRRRGRREALERARAHAESGNMAAANECYQRAVDIAPWMAKVVIEALREREVTCVVAPYEADAQMSYLALRGDVYAVLTEDSDMLAYGCPRVLYKLDRGGSGEEVVLTDLPLVRELNMTGFDHDMLLQMCILAGCDFLPNMSGVGIKKAHALIRKHRDFVKVVRFLRFNGSSPPPGYEVRFQRTIWLFRHQRVFCPDARALTHLRPLPAGGLGAADVLVLAALPPDGPERDTLPFLGPPMDGDVAAGIAAGDLDPSTLQPFDLPAIYRGCAYPPRHLRALLPPPPHAAQGTQQHGSQSQGGGSQRRLSWGGAGSSQGQGQGSQQHPPHHHHNHHHNHNSQQQHIMSQQQLARYGRPAGKPPVAPKDRIDRYFFAPNPAASQPFRHHALRSGGSGAGAAAGAGTGSSAVGRGASVPVVTLTGLPVETAEVAADCTGGEGGGAAGETAAEAGGLEEGCHTDGRAGPAHADGDGADEQDGECSLPPSAKRRRLGGYRAARGVPPAAEAGGLSTAAGPASRGPGAVPGSDPGADGSSSGGSLFARFRRDAAAAVGQRACAGGSLRPPHSQPKTPLGGNGAGELAGVQDACGAGDEPDEAAGGAFLAAAAEEAVAAGGVGGGGCGSVPDSQPAGPHSQGLTRAWSFGAASEGLGPGGYLPSGTASEYDSQYGSQFDSQLTSGCEGSGRPAWRGGSSSAAAVMGMRSRAPARLALEALFSEPSGGSAPLSQPAPSCGGSGGGGGAPCAASTGAPGVGGGGHGPGRQVMGALAAFHCWRQAGGPLVLGAPEATVAGSQPLCSAGMSLPSPSKHVREDPHPDPELHSGVRAAAAECDPLGLQGQPDTHGFDRGRTQSLQQQEQNGACDGRGSGANAAIANGGHARLGKPPPPQFSIYDLDEEELCGDLEPAPGLIAEPAGGLGNDASRGQSLDGAAFALVRALGAGRRQHARDGALHTASDGDDDGGGEAEVTSPLKHPCAPPNRSRLPPPQPESLRSPRAVPFPRLGRKSATVGPMPGLLHPSARRRLSTGQQLLAAAQGNGLVCPVAQPEPEAGPSQAGASDVRLGLEPGPGRGDLPSARMQQGAKDDAGLGWSGGSQGNGLAGTSGAGGCGGVSMPDTDGGDDGDGRLDSSCSDDPDVCAFKRALERTDTQRRQRRWRSDLREQGRPPRPPVAGEPGGGELKLSDGRSEHGGCDGDGYGGVESAADAGRGSTDGAGAGGGALATMEDPGAAARDHQEEGGGARLRLQSCEDRAGTRDADPAGLGGLEADPARDEQVLENGRGYFGGCGRGGGDDAPDMDDDGGGACAGASADAGDAGGGPSAGFHSVQHIAQFALVATRALDKLERSLPPMPSETAAAMASLAARPHPPLLAQQAPNRRASCDGAGSGRGGWAPKAAAAVAVRPLTDFAFLRSAPKRRSGLTGRAGGAGAGPLGRTPLPAARAVSCRPSVFVRLPGVDTDTNADAPPPPDEEPPADSAVSPLTTAGGLGATHGTGAAAPAYAMSRRSGGEDGGGDDSGQGAPDREDSDDSDDVVIVGEGGGPVGWFRSGDRAGSMPRSGEAEAERRVLAEVMLRRPFQAPRSNAGGAIGGVGAAGGGGRTGTGARSSGGGGGRGKGIVVRGVSKESQQPQQQRITAFQSYAFASSK